MISAPSGCLLTRTLVGVTLLLALAIPRRVAAQSACVGDCDSSGDVTVSELIAMVNIALGGAIVSTCQGGDVNNDGQITVNELVAAVNAALAACPSLPTPTPTAPLIPSASATATSTETVTPTPSPTLIPTATATSTETFTPTPSPTETGTLFIGTIAELVPHAVGDQLVYRVTDPSANVTTETTNVISADMQGGFVVDDQVTSGQQLESRQTQSYSDTGSQLLFNGFTDLFFTPHTRTTCTPPLLRLTTPLITGQTSSTSAECDVRTVDSGVLIGFVNRTDTVTPKELVERVTVPAGTFTSVVLISGTTIQNGQVETDEIYIAPGVGSILQLTTLSGQTYRHELISGTIGGHPVGP
jgi:hypothetical protein